MSSMCGTSSNGVPASGGSGLSCRWVTPTTCPMAPSRTSRVAARQGGAQRPLWLTATRTPAASARASTRGQPGQVVGRQGERLLGQHVLAGGHRRLDPVEPSLRTGGEVDVAHLRVGQQVLGAGVDAADEREPLLHRGGGLLATAPHAGHPDAVLLVRRQVGRLGDRPATRGSRRPSRSAGKRGAVSTITAPPGPRGTAARPAGSRGRLGRAARRPPPRRRRRPRR